MKRVPAEVEIETHPFASENTFVPSSGSLELLLQPPMDAVRRQRLSAWNRSEGMANGYHPALRPVNAAT